MTSCIPVQVFLLDYEQAHPENITGDACDTCGGSEDVADDCDQLRRALGPTQQAGFPRYSGVEAQQQQLLHALCSC